MRPSTPCLLTVYGEPLGDPRRPRVELVLTIAPPWPWASIASSSWRIASHVPRRLIDTTRSQLVHGIGMRGAVAGADPGAIGCAVEPAEGLGRPGYRRLDGVLVGHVSGREHRLAAGVGDRPHGGLAALGVDVDGDHARAHRREQVGGRVTDSRRGAGDQRDFPVQAVIHGRERATAVSGTSRR